MMNKSRCLETNYFIDNEYLDLYIQLINENIFTEYKKFETSCHHIIPVSYFKIINESVDNTNKNKVNLYHKDHILAHFLLTKCTKEPLKTSMIFAVNFMINEKNKYKIYNDITDIINIEEICKLKEQYCKACSINASKQVHSKEQIKKQRISFIKNQGVNSPSQLPGVGVKISKSKKGISTITEEQRKILSESATKFWTGKPKSEETKNKISNTLKGHEVSQETRNKISIACKGNITHNKNTIAVHNFKTIYLELNLIPYDQLLQYLLNNKLEMGCRQSNSRLKNRDFNYYKIKSKKQLLNIKNKYNSI